MLSFHRFTEISPALWLTLLNSHDVHRHMPLAGDDWTEQRALEWAESKDAQWAENGYGPWALKVDGVFAGWGGFQKEGPDADFGLVLLPEFWGQGQMMHMAMIEKAFGELALPSITILLPPSRVRMKGLKRLGYVPDGEIEYDGHRFLKFRMLAPK
jgi:RimJ/RimL family protein N-acetyltransferase